MKEGKKVKYISILSDSFRAFIPKGTPLKVKILLAVAAIGVSVLVSVIKIYFRVHV